MWRAPDDRLVNYTEAINTETSCCKLTEVDVSIGGVGAADPGVAGHGAALVERHELVQVVEVGEHLQGEASESKILQ
jgi:hypothetical protein